MLERSTTEALTGAWRRGPRSRPSRLSALRLLGGVAGLAGAMAFAAGHDADGHAAPARRAAAEAPAASAASVPPVRKHEGAAAAAPAGRHEDAPAPPVRPKSTASASAPPPASATDVREPLDVVRERLAKRLGAAPPATAEPNVVRLVSHDKSSIGTATFGAGSLHGAARRAKPSSGRAAEPLPAPGPHPPHWEYEGAGGPQAWSRLDPAFAACASGSRQSPIDITGGVKVELDAVRFDYRPSTFRVIDTGHTVQVNVAPGNTIEVGGRRYELVQFHFHRPSEERIEGRQYEMVVHLVHKSADGRLAVIAVLLERGPAQPIVQSVWNNLPLERGEEAAARAPLDPGALLPAERRYYTYMGSLTTPPCSEGVLWMVMKQPVGISPDQEGVFARLYPMNARPLQASAGRLIKESN